MHSVSMMLTEEIIVPAYFLHDIQLDLVFGVGEDDLLRWSLHSWCQFIYAT